MARKLKRVMPKGDAHPTAKLTEDEVRQIKRALQNGATCCSLARLFRISRAAIQSIKVGRSWKTVQ